MEIAGPRSHHREDPNGDGCDHRTNQESAYWVAHTFLQVTRPNTSRNATFKSRKARAPSPLKLEPCMMASVLGFSSASFARFCAVSGVYGTYSASSPA